MSEVARLLLPSLGDVDSAEVVEVSVAQGDAVAEGQIVALVESEKATLEVPAPVAGTVVALHISVGDQIGEGDCLLEYAPAPDAAPKQTAIRAPAAAQRRPEPPSAPPQTPVSPAPAPQGTRQGTGQGYGKQVYAGPAVRKLARQLGADLRQVRGTGIKGRIQSEDLHAWVRERLQGAGQSAALPATPWPDLARHGPVKRVPLSRIRQVSARRLHASWVNIPHVTQQDMASVGKLEELRQSLKPQAKKQGTALTPLPFLLRACALALVEFPRLRSALEPGGQALIERDSYHLGLAVDTPDGLLVPVVRNVRNKDIRQLAQECAQLADKARQGKLRPDEMAGGVFTLSSLGGIGGTAFTPIINPPEVAVLGISAMRRELVRTQSGDIDDRLMLPLSLSYDHRVINGAEAARFCRHLAEILAEPAILMRSD